MTRNSVGFILSTPKAIAMVVAILLLAAIPPVLFHRAVAFSPEHFVEEWLKLITGGVLVTLLLELTLSRRFASESLLQTHRYVRRRLIDPLRELRRQLDNETALSLFHPDALRQRWAAIHLRVLGIDSTVLPHEELEFEVAGALDVVDFQTIANFFNSLPAVSPAECERVSALLADIERRLSAIIQ